MNTFAIALMGLGVTQASGDRLMRRLEPNDHQWEEDLYFLTPGGVGVGRCEEGFAHQIFNEEECVFAVKDLGYDVSTSDTVNAWGKVCGCSFNPETGHVQFNQFAHPAYCYDLEKHAGSMGHQDKDSSTAGLIPLCYKKGPVEHAPVVNFDNYFLNPAGVGSGRCEAGWGSLIFNEKECEYAIKSLGYEVDTTEEVNAWGKVCGCSYNAETKHMQYNKFAHPDYCYDLAEHAGSMGHQDRNSREDRLVSVCYNKPELDASVDVQRGNNYMNTMGVGSGRCEAGFKQQIFNLHDCLEAVASFEEHVIKSVDTVNAWSKVCGCSFNPETGHVQFNQFAHPAYCYNREKHEGNMIHQDRNSRTERLVAVCHYPITNEPTPTPTSEPTFQPTVGLTMGKELYSTKQENAAASFNSKFKAAGTGIIKRECSNCPESHKTIFYKRITDVANFKPYNCLVDTWATECDGKSNVLNKDFELYSTLEDLQNGQNKWTYCNYNDPGVGFPRDCGPTGYVPYTWNAPEGSRHRAKGRDVTFYSITAPWKRFESSQCYVHATEHAGDRKDNPIFNGGGFIGTMTRTECMAECMTRKDPHGRKCVAIEMSTHSNDPNTKASCALAWGCDFNKGWSGGDVFLAVMEKGEELYSTKQDNAAASFNSKFKAAGTGIILRKCSNCPESHKTIFYKRITDVTDFKPYNCLVDTWATECDGKSNLLNKDFELYSTLEDLQTGQNKWTYCNYNDPGVGFPRDCGPTGYVPYTWNAPEGSRHRAKGRDVTFYSIDTTDAGRRRPEDMAAPAPKF